jgi:prepilin-type N-terminal cleavage/methylation domain-containing protein
MNPLKNLFHWRKAQSDLRAASGFTLLEVLVALTVFAIGTTVTLSLMSGSLGKIRKAQQRTHIIEHAESVMEIALLDQSILGPTTFTGYFEDGTNWSVRVDEYIPPDSPRTLRRALPRDMPIQLLSYTVEMFSPDSREPEYRLHMLKLVKKAREGP